jgi:hypothetical protein
MTATCADTSFPSAWLLSCLRRRDPRPDSMRRSCALSMRRGGRSRMCARSMDRAQCSASPMRTVVLPWPIPDGCGVSSGPGTSPSRASLPKGSRSRHAWSCAAFKRLCRWWWSLTPGHPPWSQRPLAEGVAPGRALPRRYATRLTRRDNMREAGTRARRYDGTVDRVQR